MKMTIDIDDDIIDAARNAAARDDKSLGQAISEFARRGLQDRPLIAYKNGIPVILKCPGSKPVTLELVNELRDDDFELPSRR